MNFQPPTKRAAGQCTCPPDVKDMFGHSPECPSLHPLQQTHHEYRAPERMTTEAVLSAHLRGDSGALSAEVFRARDAEAALLRRVTALEAGARRADELLQERDRRIALLEEQARYREDAIAVARRDAMYDVACEALEKDLYSEAEEYLKRVKEANTPKEGP